MKAHAIPCSHQPSTKGGNTISVAKAVVPPLAPPAAFGTGQGIIFVVESISFYNCNQDFQHCVKIYNAVMVTDINDIEWKVNICFTSEVALYCDHGFI